MGYFTGKWKDNEQRRRRRVRGILRFIRRSFDPDKCGNGCLNLDGYISFIKDLQVPVPIYFAGTGLAVVDFMLLVDPNTDGSLPYARAQALWRAMHRERLVPVRFNGTKWGKFRQWATEENFITTNGEYWQGRAMKWGIGPCFPSVPRKEQKKNIIL
jgi:hypothetical protein